MDVGNQVGVLRPEAGDALHGRRILLDDRAREYADRGQRQQPDHRAHLDALGVAIGQDQYIVEKALLFVPHLILLLAHAVHGAGNPQEVLDELVDELLIVGVMLGEFGRHREHVQTEKGHPRGAVGLFEVPAGGQRRAPVEDADVVQPQKAAVEEVAPGRVLAVDPPVEVEQQLVEGTLEKGQFFDAGLSRPPIVWLKIVAQACTGGLTSPKFHS